MKWGRLLTWLSNGLRIGKWIEDVMGSAAGIAIGFGCTDF